MRRNQKKFLYPASLAIVSGLVAVLVSGCSILGGSQAYPARYTLGVNHASAVQHDTQPRFGSTLAVRPVTVPGWLDSRRMLYRLIYRNDQKLAAYVDSAWADTPSELVAENLRQSLSDHNLFAAVLAGSTIGQARLALHVDLTDFSQYFASPRSSTGRIAGTATLVDTKTGDVIAQHVFVKVVPAPTPDANGGVQALTRADQQFDDAIAQWLADVAADQE